MKRTRNLFVLNGMPNDTILVLNDLRFKGLITFPFGNPVTDTLITESFQNNKSVVCAKRDYITGKLLKDAINIKVVSHSSGLFEEPPPYIIIAKNHFAEQFAKIADDLMLDIGDHKSNSSGQNGTPTIADCAYCRYLAGYPADNERTVYSSENFFVLPTVGQFITGYFLIIPFNHVMSNAELNPSMLLGEFTDVLHDIEYLLKLTYNAKNVLVWENGSGNGGIGKAKDSIVHSHVHICPSNLTSCDIEKMSGFPFETISLDELKKYQEHYYLLLRTPDYKYWKINNNPNLYIPRQYVRQLVAEEYGLPGESWNWRTHHFSEKMYQTVEDIKSSIQKNRSSIPERIQNNTKFLF